jgi:hypothetical protein
MIDIKDKDTGKRRRLKVDDTNQWFKEELEWLKEEVEKAKQNGENVCILTHHAPLTTGTSAPGYEGSECNCAFSTDLQDLMGGNVKLWGFGHTHYSSNQTCNGTLVVSNQLGYVGMSEKSGYSTEGSFDVPSLKNENQMSTNNE